MFKKNFNLVFYKFSTKQISTINIFKSNILSNLKIEKSFFLKNLDLLPNFYNNQNLLKEYFEFDKNPEIKNPTPESFQKYRILSYFNHLSLPKTYHERIKNKFLFLLKDFAEVINSNQKIEFHSGISYLHYYHTIRRYKLSEDHLLLKQSEMFFKDFIYENIIQKSENFTKLEIIFSLILMDSEDLSQLVFKNEILDLNNYSLQVLYNLFFVMMNGISLVENPLITKIILQRFINEPLTKRTAFLYLIVPYIKTPHNRQLTSTCFQQIISDFDVSLFNFGDLQVYCFLLVYYQKIGYKIDQEFINERVSEMLKYLRNNEDINFTHFIMQFEKLEFFKFDNKQLKLIFEGFLYKLQGLLDKPIDVHSEVEFNYIFSMSMILFEKYKVMDEEIFQKLVELIKFEYLKINSTIFQSFNFFLKNLTPTQREIVYQNNNKYFDIIDPSQTKKNWIIISYWLIFNKNKISENLKKIQIYNQFINTNYSLQINLPLLNLIKVYHLLGEEERKLLLINFLDLFEFEKLKSYKVEMKVELACYLLIIADLEIDVQTYNRVVILFFTFIYHLDVRIEKILVALYQMMRGIRVPLKLNGVLCIMKGIRENTAPLDQSALKFIFYITILNKEFGMKSENLQLILNHFDNVNDEIRRIAFPDFSKVVEMLYTFLEFNLISQRVINSFLITMQNFKNGFEQEDFLESVKVMANKILLKLAERKIIHKKIVMELRFNDIE
jgi:hypothetical protein